MGIYARDEQSKIQQIVEVQIFCGGRLGDRIILLTSSTVADGIWPS